MKVKPGDSFKIRCSKPVNPFTLPIPLLERVLYDVVEVLYYDPCETNRDECIQNILNGDDVDPKNYKSIRESWDNLSEERWKRILLHEINYKEKYLKELKKLVSGLDK